MMNHKPWSRVVIEKLRKVISTHSSSIPIVQEDTSQVDDSSLPSRSGKIVGTSADDELETGSEPAQHVTIDA